MTPRLRSVAAVAGGMVLLVACSWVGAHRDAGAPAPTPPLVTVADAELGVEGISYEEAIATAQDYLHLRFEFIRADAGTLGDFDKPGGVALVEESRDRMVWAVFFRGIVPISCPLTPPEVASPNCPDMDAEILVVLDYYTGETLYQLNTAWPP